MQRRRAAAAAVMPLLAALLAVSGAHGCDYEIRTCDCAQLKPPASWIMDKQFEPFNCQTWVDQTVAAANASTGSGESYEPPSISGYCLYNELTISFWCDVDTGDWVWSNVCPDVQCMGQPNNPNFAIPDATWPLSAPCMRGRPGAPNDVSPPGTTCTPQCNRGFNPAPNAAALTSTCTGFGNWTRITGSCKRPVQRCVSPPPTSLGPFGAWDANCTNVTVGSSCNLLCWSPTRVSNGTGWLVPKAVCNQFGDWDYVGDQCPASTRPCSNNLPAAGNGAWVFTGPWVLNGTARPGEPYTPSGALYSYWFPGAPVPSTWLSQAGNTFTLACATNYTSSISPTLPTTTCQPDGTWGVPTGTCTIDPAIAYPCTSVPTFTVPGGVAVTWDPACAGTPVGRFCTGTCAAGYYSTRPLVTTCQSNRGWSPPSADTSCVPNGQALRTGCFKEPLCPCSAGCFRTKYVLKFLYGNTFDPTDPDYARNVTVAGCINSAKALGYAYAGMQFKAECYGGNDISGYNQTATTCTQSCEGGATQVNGQTETICGGVCTNNVWTTGLATCSGFPSAPPANARPWPDSCGLLGGAPGATCTTTCIAGGYAVTSVCDPTTGRWGPAANSAPGGSCPPTGRHLLAHEAELHEDSTEAELQEDSATSSVAFGSTSDAAADVPAPASESGDFYTHMHPTATPDELQGMRALLMRSAAYELPQAAALPSRTVTLRPLVSYNQKDMHAVPLRVFDTTWAGHGVEDATACLAGALVHLDVGVDMQGLSAAARQMVERAMELPLVSQLRRLLADGGVYTSAMAHPDPKFRLSTKEMKADLAEHQESLLHVPRCMALPAQLLELPRHMLSELSEPAGAWPQSLRLSATVRSVVQKRHPGMCEGLEGSSLAIQPLLSPSEASAAMQSGTPGMVWVFAAAQDSNTCLE